MLPQTFQVAMKLDLYYIFPRLNLISTSQLLLHLLMNFRMLIH